MRFVILREIFSTGNDRDSVPFGGQRFHPRPLPSQGQALTFPHRGERDFVFLSQPIEEEEITRTRNVSIDRHI